MQLRIARLCLDCEEVHDAPQCPVCASETFAYLTRWVPVPERRQRPRTTEPAVSETATAYREILHPPPTTPWRAIRRGAVGLALFGVAGWLWRRSSPEASGRSGTSGKSGRSGSGSA